MSLLILVFSTTCLFSEDTEEPLLENLRDTFQKKYLSFGMVLQTVADFQVERSFPGNNGFNISNLRLRVYGELDKNFSYFMMANFINSVSILDTRIDYRFSKKFILRAGLFKTSFSKEFLTGAESIDFVNRSRIVAVVAPGRQIGVQAQGWLFDSFPIWYGAGIFNGNSFGSNVNDNNDFLYSGRISLHPFKTKSTQQFLEIGVNGAFSKDRTARISANLNPFVFEPVFFRGDRTLYGVDIRYSSKKLLLAGEYLMGEFDGEFTLLSSDEVIGDLKPQGYYFTTGYMMTKNTQILARLDSFKFNNNQSNSEWIILGFNIWPTEVAEFQFNYIIDSDEKDVKFNQLLVNAQVAF
jgi:hypothetical protein